MSDKVTIADLHAFILLQQASQIPMDTRQDSRNIVEAGNKIIELANRIKTQRQLLAID